MHRRFRLQTGSPYEVSRPGWRELRAYSVDPSLAGNLATVDINETVIRIPWESHPDKQESDGPAPGPRGEYLDVIDFDPATGCYYQPVDLNQPYLLAQNGLPPSDGNPQFHQQMVYAVAMRTIRNFEIALGRRSLWSPRRYSDTASRRDEFVGQLRIYPHALREANAYYSPKKKALLFGYFQAMPEDITDHLPGGMVFTCLSHDIIAHETTHALLDGMHRRFLEPTNLDVLAFHEAFSDIVALFQHFSLPDVLRHQVGSTRGKLDKAPLLGELAQQFGNAIGRGKALRSAINTTPDPEALEHVLEPHARGAILVAAVFDAFVSIYERRTADLVRLASDGTGTLEDGEIHPDLVNRLSEEAVKSANHVLKMCIRALDYLPPVDITFGDYLRAIVTADADLFVSDERRYRVAFIEAFRRRGIFPGGVKSLSEESLRWETANLATGYNDPQVYLGKRLKEILDLWSLDGSRQEIFDALTKAKGAAHGIIMSSMEYKEQLLIGADLGRKFEVHSIRPVRRTGPDGQLILEVVVEITQRRPGYFDKTLDDADWPDDTEGVEPDFWYRGGCTLLVDMNTNKLRYCIYKDIHSEHRYERTKRYLGGKAGDPSLRGTYFSATKVGVNDEIFAFVHRHSEAEVGHED